MKPAHYRYAHDDGGAQRRFYELRFDPDERRVSGTAMRYGDTAELPWGEKERFEPGAFGEVGGLDVILNVQHNRSKLVARTGGGGLTLMDGGGQLTVEAVLPDTTDARDAVANIQAKILRGLSVEFMPEETRTEGDTIIVEKAVLRNIGIVDRPAYPKSKLIPRHEGDDMKPEEIKDLIQRTVKEAIETRAQSDGAIDAGAIATAVGSALADTLEKIPTAESVRAQVDDALKARDDAQADKEKAEQERAAAESQVEARADLLVMLKPLLPDGTETRGKSNHDLLVLAVGDEVEDAAKRSEDYLLAKVESIAERRAAAGTGSQPGGRPTPGQPTPGASKAPIDIISLRNAQ